MSSLPRLGIVADDLTGACDSSAPFAVAGRRTLVEIVDYAASVSLPEVLACTTDSRADSPKEAAKKARLATQNLVRRGYTKIFKKIDSTLLGNIGVEILSVLDASGGAIAVVAPSFPATGRTIVCGRLLIGGDGADSGRSLPEILRCETGLTCHTIDLTDLESGSEALAGVILSYIRSGCRLLAVDGRSDQHLDTVVNALARLGNAALPVGSGGLAARLAVRDHHAARASTINFPSHTPDLPGHGRSPRSSAMVVFAGSRNPTTRAQLDALCQAHSTIELSGDTMSTTKIAQALSGGVQLVIHVCWESQQEKALAEAIRACAAAGALGVILTGGDTARLVCRLGKCSAIELQGEIAPGLPYGQFVDGILSGVPVATKAGGFGKADAMLSVLQQFETSVAQPT